MQYSRCFACPSACKKGMKLITNYAGIDEIIVFTVQYKCPPAALYANKRSFKGSKNISKALKEVFQDFGKCQQVGF